MQKEEYLKKVELIKKYNHQYYVLSKPTVSDKKYDRILSEVIEYEKTHKVKSIVTKKPGSDKQLGFFKSNHKKPMLSLENSYNPNDVYNFIKGLPNNTLIYFEDKIDGLSLSLTYKNGRLVKAVTRGDGKQGDVVTQNALSVIGIEGFIQPEFTGEIRGEVYINKDDFDLINIDNEYANPRNLASGTLKTLKKPDLISKRKLRFIAYYCDFDGCMNYTNSIKKLKYLRFITPKQQVCIDTSKLDLEAISKLLNDMGNTNLEYPVDGVVIKIDKYSLRTKLGEGTKYPKWAKAYKYPSTEAHTTLLDVEFSVGRTGVVTPIAIFKPVELCGTTVKRATLHNYDFIKKLGIRYDDIIAIEKGGEIIPKVTKVITTERGNKIKYPEICPVCGGNLEKTDGANIICPNKLGTCKSQLIETMAHFASREALNIVGLGPKVCEQIYIDLKKHSILDIMCIEMDELLTLDGFKERSAFKLYKAIKNTWNKPMERWLFGLGIPGIGKILAENICKEFPTWYKLFNASKEDLNNIPLLGKVLTDNLYHWLNNPDNKLMVRELIRKGMTKRYDKKVTITSNLLEGRKIVITGIFNNYSREFLAKQIENLGGIYHSSVKKDSNTLLYGQKSGKKKRQHALDRGLEVLYVKESLALLNLK